MSGGVQYPWEAQRQIRVRRKDGKTRTWLSRSGSAVILGAFMMLSCAGLWVGVPLLCLWTGSMLQAAGVTLALVIAAMFVVLMVSMLVIGLTLGYLRGADAELRAARGKPAGESHLLETILVATAVIAAAVFGAWFLLIAGPGPDLVGGH